MIRIETHYVINYNYAYELRVNIAYKFYHYNIFPRYGTYIRDMVQISALTHPS